VDGDGYGSPASAGCPFPEGDCDDANPEIHPGAAEHCDGVDNNCTDGIDEAPAADQDCDGTADDGDPGCSQDLQAFRIVAISDAEICQDDMYEKNNHLDQVVAAINARADIDFVVILGDLAARFYERMWDQPWWQDPPYDPSKTWDDAFALAVDSLANLNVPFYFVPGEKDYTEL